MQTSLLHQTSMPVFLFSFYFMSVVVVEELNISPSTTRKTSLWCITASPTYAASSPSQAWLHLGCESNHGVIKRSHAQKQNCHVPKSSLYCFLNSSCQIFWCTMVYGYLYRFTCQAVLDKKERKNSLYELSLTNGITLCGWLISILGWPHTKSKYLNPTDWRIVKSITDTDPHK